MVRARAREHLAPYVPSQPGWRGNIPVRSTPGDRAEAQPRLAMITPAGPGRRTRRISLKPASVSQAVYSGSL